MHIPDGFISPQTAVMFYGVSMPFVYRATQVVQKKLETKFVPKIALMSAFSFIVMMFNIPLPGGTTGHATGAAVAGILLGPWGGILAITMSLTIQALLFGDGGILALGANIWNMAIVMPVVSWFIFTRLHKLMSGKYSQVILSALVGYIAINIAALLTAIELGIQPILFHTVNGQPLYFPFDIQVAIPAMMIGHVLIAGFAEAAITAGILYWMRKEAPISTFDMVQQPTLKSVRIKLFIVMLFFLFLTPLGLLAPGTAWGEWSREELLSMGLGVIPVGFDRWTDIWSAPFPDYTLNGLSAWIGYILSGAIGVVIIYAGIAGIFLVLKHSKRRKVTDTKHDTSNTSHI